MANPNLQALRAARRVASRAYAPYSKYKVGCAIITNSGKLHTGANVENSSYSATMCAERVALGKHSMESYNSIDDIKIIAIFNEKKLFRPCGVCLQALREFCIPSTEVIVYTLGKEYGIREVKFYKFRELLPHPF